MAEQNPGLINVYQSKQLSKPLVIFFSLTQLILGLKYGFFNILNKNLRALANFVSILTFVVISMFMWIPNGQFWLEIITNAYYVWVFLVLRFSNYSLHTFLKDIMDIDAKWKLVVKDPHVFLKTLLYIFAYFCIRGLIFLYSCYLLVKINGRMEIGHWVPQYVGFTMFFILSVVNMLVFYQVYLRINVLKSSLEAKIMLVKDARMFFKSLADCLAKIRVSHDNIIAVGFGVYFLRPVFVIGYELQFSVSKDGDIMYFYRQIHIVVEILQWLLEICLPAVFAEILAAEVDKTKMVIHERLLTETDGDIKEGLLHLLGYVEARPLLHKAWRLVPVGLQLPITLLNMTVTYLIVLLQFKHVF